ncbi:MAG: hypothetical protein Q4G67_13735 [Actinomycetia bacterium]|nr:hypothetical protein [Actinomycetes bacterium]
MATTRRDLFARLIDDAAVFPPGSSPLPVAVRDHHEHRQRPYAWVVGPLLVPASSWGELTETGHDSDESLQVGLISRPGDDVALVGAAVSALRERDDIEVAGVELGWSPTWHNDLGAVIGAVIDEGLGVALELPRGPEQQRAIDGIRAARAQGRAVVAKFRTGPTPTWSWPEEAELAGVLRAVVDAGVPLKLTGGLHHAVRGRYTPAGGAEEDNHGLLNILAATHAACIDAPREDIAAILAERDPVALTHRIEDLHPGEVACVREVFTAYGCCTVTDPITELEDLQLLPDDTTTNDKD